MLSFCFTLTLPRYPSLFSLDPLNSLTFSYSHMLDSITAVNFMLITNKAATEALLLPELFQTHFLKMCAVKV